MRLLLTILVTVFLLGSPLFGHTKPKIHYAEGVVLVLIPTETGYGHCTGFYIAIRTIMTAAHCHTDKNMVMDDKGILYPLLKLKIDTQVDLVTYHIDKTATYIFELRRDGPAFGEWLWVYSRMGVGHSHLLVHSVQALNPSTEYPFGGWFVFLTPRLIPGQSGSPIFDERGRLVSVAVRTSHPHTWLNHTGLGVTHQDIKMFLN